MTNPVYDLLTQGQDKIRDPKNWTQHATARDTEGNPVNQYDPNAICWCSLGALNISEATFRERITAVNLLEQAMGVSVPVFNDNNPHQTVMAKWDEAREVAKSA